MKIFNYLILGIIGILVVTLAFKNLPQNKVLSALNPAPTPVPTKNITLNGKTLDVMLAQTPAEQQRGLSGTTHLNENGGMLFVFPKGTRTAFWMKDMVIAIDIIWIQDNKIIQIDKNLVPPEPNTAESQLKLYTPNQPIDYVLEVNAGYSEKNNLKVGDELTL